MGYCFTRNTELTTVYEEFFRSKNISEPLASKCTAPLLASITQNWFDGNKRILVVGQETLRWGFELGKNSAYPNQQITNYSEFLRSDVAVASMMDWYEQFAFATGFVKFSSPFWDTFKQLGSELGCHILWSNLFRLAINGGSVLANGSIEDHQALLKFQRGLLAKEISVLKPTAVIFLTGPNYDFAIKDEFVDAKFMALGGFTERQFSIVIATGLPEKTFRLYHPGYLARRKDGARWNQKLIELLRR